MGACWKLGALYNLGLGPDIMWLQQKMIGSGGSWKGLGALGAQARMDGFPYSEVAIQKGSIYGRQISVAYG
jgi:hypothetical protein